jgi:hypothetical protein
MTYSNNSSLPTLDMIQTAFGLTPLMNILWFYQFVVVGSIGFILNISSFVIFINGKFDIPLYQFLRVYALNSSIICLVSIFLFACNSSRLFPWANARQAQDYISYVYIPIMNTCYFFSTLLDILITIERISLIKTRFKLVLKLTAYKMCMAAFLLCCIINVPFYFTFQTSSALFQLDTGSAYTIWFPEPSAFARSRAGMIINFIIAFIRNLFLMTVEILLNVISIYYFKQYLIKHSKAVQTLRGNMVHGIAEFNGTPNQYNTNNQHLAREPPSHATARSDQRACFMVTSLCILSIFEHVIFTASDVYTIFFNSTTTSETTFLFYFSTMFSCVLKHALNFPLFVIFNKNFKRACWSHLSRSMRSTTSSHRQN